MLDRLLIVAPDFESDPLDRIRLDLGCDFSSDGDHVRQFTERPLRDLLERCGWKTDEVWRHGGVITAVAD
jgi:hypothetical protein